jgi:hypothetical protein
LRFFGEGWINQQTEAQAEKGGLCSRRHVMLFQFLELKQYNMPFENVFYSRAWREKSFTLLFPALALVVDADQFQR